MELEERLGGKKKEKKIKEEKAKLTSGETESNAQEWKLGHNTTSFSRK